MLFMYTSTKWYMLYAEWEPKIIAITDNLNNSIQYLCIKFCGTCVKIRHTMVQ